MVKESDKNDYETVKRSIKISVTCQARKMVKGNFTLGYKLIGYKSHDFTCESTQKNYTWFLK